MIRFSISSYLLLLREPKQVNESMGQPRFAAQTKGPAFIVNVVIGRKTGKIEITGKCGKVCADYAEYGQGD